MAENNGNKTKKNGKKIIIVIAIIVIMIAVALIYKFFIEDKELSVDEGLQAQEQIDYNNRLEEIQTKIDEQQKVIDELNNQLKPLVEERTKLENQLIQITSPEILEEQPQETTDVIE